jgi:hypothetical protein
MSDLGDKRTPPTGSRHGLLDSEKVAENAGHFVSLIWLP